MPRRVATVDVDTWLFPQHTLDALVHYLARDSVDEQALLSLVQTAVAGRDIQMHVTSDRIQYRNGPLDTYHDLILIEELRGPQGVQGEPGLPGKDGTGGGGGGQRLTYEESLPSDTWVIYHNFGYPPVVVVVDTAGTVIEGEVQYPDAMTVVILHNVPVSGTAYLS